MMRRKSMPIGGPEPSSANDARISPAIQRCSVKSLIYHSGCGFNKIQTQATCDSMITWLKGRIAAAIHTLGELEAF